MKINSNGLHFEVEDSAFVDGQWQPELAARPAVLLIMGLGMQLIAWPPQLVQGLTDAGYRVIRMDNRDIGLSAHLDSLGKPKIVWQLLKHRLGLRPNAPYSLADMAADSIGVLGALGIHRAHIVGVSMGGMIAQRIAIAAPRLTLSLTSIMSSSGARNLPRPHRRLMRLMVSRPASHNPIAVIDHSVKLFRAIGSPAYPFAELELRERVGAAVKRSLHPQGTLRQMMAIAADITRAAQLSRITSATLVVHGKADPLVPFACGEDTAHRIRGARLLAIEGMGHDLPPEPLAQILKALIPHLQAADAAHKTIPPEAST